MNIPDEAVKAASDAVYEAIPIVRKSCDEVAASALAAALPHLLADHRDRLVTAAGRLDESKRGEVDDQFARTRLAGKAEGVRLALSYLDELTR